MTGKGRLVLLTLLILSVSLPVFGSPSVLPDITVSSEFSPTGGTFDLLAGFGVKLDGQNNVQWTISVGGGIEKGEIAPFAAVKASQLQTLGFIGYYQLSGTIVGQWVSEPVFGLAANCEGAFGNVAGSASVYYVGQGVSSHLASAYGFPFPESAGWGLVAKSSYRLANSNMNWSGSTRLHRSHSEMIIASTTGPEFTLGGWRVTGQAGIRRTLGVTAPLLFSEAKKGKMTMSLEAWAENSGGWKKRIGVASSFGNNVELGIRYSEDTVAYLRFRF